MPNKFRAFHCENYSANFGRGFTRFFRRSCDRTLILLNPSMVDTGNKLYEINCRVFVSIEIEINEVSQIMYIVMSAMGIKGLYIATPLPMDPSQYRVQTRRVSSVKSTSLKFPALVSAKQRENIVTLYWFLIHPKLVAIPI